jgi:hypothetical protein
MKCIKATSPLPQPYPKWNSCGHRAHLLNQGSDKRLARAATLFSGQWVFSGRQSSFSGIGKGGNPWQAGSARPVFARNNVKGSLPVAGYAAAPTRATRLAVASRRR